MNTLDNLVQKLLTNTISPVELDQLKVLINNDANQGEIEEILDAQFNSPRNESEGLTAPEKKSILENVPKLTQPGLL